MTYSNWRKSSFSFSNGNCLEVASSWRTPARSAGNGACAEIGHAPGTIAVRDSKDPDGPVLQFTPAAWQAFTDAAKTAHLAY